MRNGNEDSARRSACGWYGSYPTYEEWKQLITNWDTFISQCSYPTYEEWKQKSIADSELQTASLFLSYL